MEFSDGMQAVSFALNTGYSIENAFAEAVGELELLYGKESSIVREFRMMVNRIKRNENLEDIMDDYAKTLNIDDVSYFRKYSDMPKEVVVIFQRLLNRRQNDKGKVRSPDGNRHDNKWKKNGAEDYGVYSIGDTYIS